ncbi:MAG: divalent-cation tolerance protein CutA [Gemmatimonadota bacterium]
MVEDGASVDRSGRVSLVLTTAPDAAIAERLVRSLVEQRLIACGNIVPGLVSLYRWDGKIAREGEVLVLMKAGAADVDRLFERINELHPYAVPELVELPVDGVSKAYGRWVIDSTKVSA